MTAGSLIARWCAMVVLTAGAARADSPSVIQMSDGAKLTFLGFTTGQNHSPPGYENLRTANRIYTASNETVAWVLADHDPSKWPSYELLVSDTAKTACVSVEKQTGTHVQSGLDIQGFVLKAFPRWEKELLLRARGYRGPVADGQFLATNPEQVPAPKWMAEDLPATKSDGDLVVTLTNLTAGVLQPYRRGVTPPVNDPANKGVHLYFGFQENGQAVTNWNPRLVDTFDAAGNRTEGVITVYPENGIYDYPRTNPFLFKRDGYFYQPGLWPDRSPWKVRLEFTKTSGYSDEEILTLTNLPVRAGTRQEFDKEWTSNGSDADFTLTPATVNGINVKLAELLIVPNQFQPDQKDLTAILYADGNPASEGMRLTLIEATDEGGKPVRSIGGAPWAGHFSLDFANAGNIKKLNLTLALHRSRFVEFTVNP